MKTIIILLAIHYHLDTLPAILKVRQGNYTKYLKGMVVLTKDCKVVEYLRIKHHKGEIELMSFGTSLNIVDYRLAVH